MDEVIDVSHFADASMVMHVSDRHSSCETSEGVYVPSTPEHYKTDEETMGDGAEEDAEAYSIKVTSTPKDLPAGSGGASSEPQQSYLSPATTTERLFVTQYKVQANIDIERIMVSNDLVKARAAIHVFYRQKFGKRRRTSSIQIINPTPLKIIQACHLAPKKFC